MTENRPDAFSSTSRREKPASMPPTPLFPISGDEALFPDSTISPTELTGLMPTPVSVPGAQALTGLMTMPCPLCATPEVPARPLPPDENDDPSDAHS